MPGSDDKNETEEEEMEQDTPESEKSDFDDESESGSGSDDDISDMDEEECERRRIECLQDMIELEHQFLTLKEHLYQERVAQVDHKLNDVKSGKANEYLNPLAQLNANMQIRTQVAGILKELRIMNIKNKYEAEQQASNQHYISEKVLLHDQIKADLEDKIRRLEEDRHNIDISSENKENPDLWNESQASLKKQKKKGGNRNTSLFSPERRRKPVPVSGPYIVYMLKDMDIIDDWTAIKKALKQQQRRKDLFKAEPYPYHARYDDGKLFYEGEWYSKGNHIVIDNREDSPVRASVTAINTGEVWVKRADGNKSKLYIAQLQKGKYTIRHISGPGYFP